MRNAQITLLFILFQRVVVIAQEFPPAFNITGDTVLQASIPNNYWQVLKDPGGTISFEQVRNTPLSDQFHTDSANKIDFKVSTYWFRFILKNVTNRSLKIGIYDLYKAKSDWYISKPNGETTHILSGRHVPWSQNHNLRLNFYFLPETFVPLTLEPGELLIIYNRAHYDFFDYSTDNPRQFVLSYGSTEKVIAQNYVYNDSQYLNSMHNAFFLGMMFLAAIFNFLFYLVVREKVYIYFALHVFFLALGRFNINAEFYHAFLREHPVFYVYYSQFLWALSPLFLGLFIHSLPNSGKSTRWDRYLLFFTWFTFFAMAANPVIAYMTIGSTGWEIGGYIGTIALFIFYLIIIVNLFQSLKRSTAFYKRFLVAIIAGFAIWLLGFTLFSIVTSYINPNNGYTTWIGRNWHTIETVCLSWLVVCFSWLLFHRFVELKQEVMQKELEKEVERRQLAAQQKVELEKQVAERTSELKQSLENLKSTQSQLIHSEKMASLGELTAGIAHEIQNPLNFVNNFSEVNNELIDELKSENPIPIGIGMKFEKQADILDTIYQNNEKIKYHGKRADAIVKGMLQHSRAGGGQKEPTDINALCDEYLRLAYYGFRTKDNSFDATIKTEFDHSIGTINIVPQELGRAVLNLFNNAFYAVNEKAKRNISGYEPIVVVSTMQFNGKIEIGVKDNGNGIADSIKEKIFQPFFTTKPTGQGTGLGLSLAYDIVKAHGGEIRVETNKGQGVTFLIQLSV